jgi:predicted RNA binding protein YcfA (HicA-like mRNA interferase family)
MYGMDKIPSLKARDVIRALKTLGFYEDHQKGGHLVLRHRMTRRRTVIPIHGGKDIKKPLLKKIIEEDAGSTVEEFLRVL